MHQRFTPYGTLLARDSAGSSMPKGFHVGWTGREYDAETGFTFHRARYYSPDLRRWTQEDPIGYAGGGNLYAYVGGAVMEARDPSGLVKDCSEGACGNPHDWSGAWGFDSYGNYSGGGGTWGERAAAGLISGAGAFFDVLERRTTRPNTITVKYADGRVEVYNNIVVSTEMQGYFDSCVQQSAFCGSQVAAMGANASMTYYLDLVSQGTLGVDNPGRTSPVGFGAGVGFFVELKFDFSSVTLGNAAKFRSYSPGPIDVMIHEFVHALGSSPSHSCCTQQEEDYAGFIDTFFHHWEGR